MNMSVPLSKDGIRLAVREVEAYRARLAAREQQFVRRVAEIGLLAARSAPVDTGELQGSITLEKIGPSHYAIVADSDHAAYVEFGTGVVGEGTYPETPQGWEYNRDSPHKDDTGEWTFWWGERGFWMRTRGHAAQPFMLPAAEAMRNAVPRIAREVFGNVR